MTKKIVRGDSLGNRMKTYEQVSSGFIMRRTPVLIRLDGKAFHTFIKHIKPDNDESMVNNPFSHKLHKIMVNTMIDVCSEIQNAKLAYTQSDEISILLTDWNTLTTDQWFGARIQKIASVSASLATAYFNYYYAQEFSGGVSYKTKIALFDSRVFNLPDDDVTNYFIWRQNDATRNSIQMLGHYHFSQSKMHGLNMSQIQDALMMNKEINWNDLEVWKKRGTCYHPKCNFRLDGSEYLDENIPIFTTNRDYVNSYLMR